MSITELAAAIGVSRQQLHGYIKRGCPTDSPEAVRAWRLDNVQRRRGVSPEAGESLQAKLLQAQIDKATQEARAKRLKNDLLSGQLYDAQDVERDVAELTGLIRSRLEAIPDELVMEFAPEHRATYQQRLEEKIRLVLTEMSQWRLSSWDAPTVDEPDEDELAAANRPNEA